MNWEQLLSLKDKATQARITYWTRWYSSGFEVDYDRIIFSAALEVSKMVIPLSKIDLHTSFDAQFRSFGVERSRTLERNNWEISVFEGSAWFHMNDFGDCSAASLAWYREPALDIQVKKSDEYFFHWKWKKPRQIV
jgi:hypothetical protein